MIRKTIVLLFISLCLFSVCVFSETGELVYNINDQNSIQCYETDNGQDYENMGTLFFGGITVIDSCDNDKLYEYVCGENTREWYTYANYDASIHMGVEIQAENADANTVRFTIMGISEDISLNQEAHFGSTGYWIELTEINSEHLDIKYNYGNDYYFVKSYQCENDCVNGECTSEMGQIPIDDSDIPDDNIPIINDNEIEEECYISTDCGELILYSCVDNECNDAVCGDGICNSDSGFGPSQAGETISNCPQDCAPDINCSDSDNGKNYDVKGEVMGYIKGTITSQINTDQCFDDAVIEYFCEDEYFFDSETHDCEFGCLQGRCLAESEQNQCEIIRLRWIDTSQEVIETIDADFMIETENCIGETLEIKVYENDFLIDDLVDTLSVVIGSDLQVETWQTQYTGDFFGPEFILKSQDKESENELKITEKEHEIVVCSGCSEDWSYCGYKNEKRYDNCDDGEILSYSKNPEEYYYTNNCPKLGTEKPNRPMTCGAGLVNPILQSQLVEIYSKMGSGMGTGHPTTVRYEYSDVLIEGSNIYLAVSEYINVDTDDGWRGHNIVKFFKSSDSGKTWKDMGNVAQSFAYWVTIKKYQDNLYVITSNKVYTSNNDGNTWTRISLPEPTSGHKKSMDFLPLDNENYIVTYVHRGCMDETHDLKIAKSTDAGDTWNIKTLEEYSQSNHNSRSYAYPELVKKDSKIYLVYTVYDYFYYHPRGLSLVNRVSNDLGQTWSSPRTALSNYKGQITSAYRTDIYMPYLYHLFVDDDHNMILGYKIDEKRGEVTYDAIGFSKGKPLRTWETDILSFNGDYPRIARNGFMNFAASDNGKYLAFIFQGGLGDNFGAYLIYSVDSADSWKSEKLPGNWFSRYSVYPNGPSLGVDGRMPNFAVTDFGEILFAYPSTKYVDRNAGLVMMFVSGKLD